MDMKQKMLFGFLALYLMCGCGKQAICEKAIADFVQTDKKGVWTDLHFKVLEMGEPVIITVGDSIRILTDAFETDRKKKLDFATGNIGRYQKSLEKEKFPSMQKFYRHSINKQQSIVDSLSRLAVALPESYKVRPVTDVLAMEIVCKFSIVPPMYNTREEMTGTFLLNAAGDKCYRRRNIK